MLLTQFFWFLKRLWERGSLWSLQIFFEANINRSQNILPYVISTRSSTCFVKSMLPQNTMGWYQLKKNQTNILSTFSRHQFLLIFQYCCTISTILPMCLRRLPISYKKKNPNFLPGWNGEVLFTKTNIFYAPG